MTVLTTIRGAFDLRRPLARIGAALAVSALAACEPIGDAASGPQTGQMIDPSQPVQVAMLVPEAAKLNKKGLELRKQGKTPKQIKTVGLAGLESMV